MKKSTHKINLEFTFNSERKGAKYTLNGIKWMNGGEFAEVVTKSVLGYEAHKDANTPYDKGSDLEELNASIKSSRFTLTTTKLGESFNEVINRYFETVHSTLWIYTVVIEDTATLYYMNADEFKSFLNTFATFATDRKVIRGKETSVTMIKWLEDRVEG